ncbi:MAG: motility associated factor glycosyltransferase family protein [Eubacteriales bacterium]
MKWSLCNARTGLPTVKVTAPQKSFYLNSSYDPVKEASRWVDNLRIQEANAPGYFVFLGMAAGYHARALHQAFPDVPVYVWDFNSAFAKWLRNSGLLSWLETCSGKIIYRDTESIRVIQKEFLPQVQNEDSLLLVHPPSLEIIPDCLYVVRQVLDEFLLFKRTVNAQQHLLHENFRLNSSLNDPGISRWMGKYVNQPMLLVSAGPSLTKQMSLLREVNKKGSAVIGSVGTALTPLIESGIKPDFVMISDPQEVIIEQLENVRPSDIPLFYLCTASARAVACYPGPKNVVWQKGFREAEIQAAGRHEPLVQTGGSVATCLLDLMVQMGGNPIALVGQDLAFTGGKSHADGTHGLRSVDSEAAALQIDDFYKTGKVSTSRNLYAYLRWFEHYVRDRKEPARFWNCTEGGAYIEGWKHASLEDYLQNSGLKYF